MSIVDILQSHRLFAAFLLLSALSANAGDWQQAIESDLCSRWHEIAGPGSDCAVAFPGLSPNFQLPACQQPWQINLLRPLQPGRNGLELGCEQPWWRQNLAVQLQVFKPVAVLARAVGLDQPLQAGDVSLVRHDIGTLSKGFFTSTDQVVGLQIRRNLRAGTILTADMLALPVIVSRGEQVSIRVARPGIQIEMKGTALEAGREGDRIRVRNDQSQRIVSAVVLERGLVQVD